MVKRIAVWIIAVMFFAGTTSVFAKDGGGKGPHPSEKAYEHANGNARFKRTGDVKNKEAEKAAKQAEKEAKKAQKEAKKKQKEIEKEAKKANKGLNK